MKEPRPTDPGEENITERGHPGPPEDDELRDPRGGIPTWGPVEYGQITGDPLLADNLGDPTRRKHPTILSEEGEEEAPATEIPAGEST